MDYPPNSVKVVRSRSHLITNMPNPSTELISRIREAAANEGFEIRNFG
jgi:hypothetical protein